MVHLAPLNPLLLRQGDFYLQVESWEEQSVHMTLKCLSSDLRKVDRKPIPETSYSLIFTPEWLEAINSDFEGSPLHTCLVASENGITPVPWTRITSPEFIDDRPPVVNIPSSDGDTCPLEALHLSSPQEPSQASSLGSVGSVVQSWAKDKGKLSRDKYPGLIKVEPAGPGQVAFRMDSETNQGPEGDYVALLGFLQECRRGSPDREVVTLGVDTQGCVKPTDSGEKPCSGGSRRKARHKASDHSAERQPQQPHVGVLEKPPDSTSGLVEDTDEEPGASEMQTPLGMPAATVQLRPGPRQTPSPLLSSAAPVALASETKTEETTPGYGRPSKAEAFLSRNISIRESPAPGLQFSFLKGQRAPLTPPEKSLLQHVGKALSPLNSLQPCRAKAPGKGKNTHSSGQKPGFPGAGGCERQGSQGCPRLRSVELSKAIR